MSRIAPLNELDPQRFDTPAILTGEAMLDGSEGRSTRRPDDTVHTEMVTTESPSTDRR